VQRIKNEFTVKVYEFHARVALQSVSLAWRLRSCGPIFGGSRLIILDCGCLFQADLGEYNQCQSVLKQLYEHGLPGCAAEFLGYRILYMIHTKNMSGKSSTTPLELTSASQSLTEISFSNRRARTCHCQTLTDSETRKGNRPRSRCTCGHHDGELSSALQTVCRARVS
jgi:hypothetical protein